jgi:xylulokinase
MSHRSVKRLVTAGAAYNPVARRRAQSSGGGADVSESSVSGSGWTSARPLVAGIDSSTQSTKVELRELDTGEVVGVGRAFHPSTTPPRSEQDPRSWWTALLEALSRLGPDLERVVAVAVAAQQHGLVVLGEDGWPLRPAKLWNDTESAAHAEALVERLGADRLAELCGSVPTASFTATKLAWLIEREPDVIRRTARIMLPHDYLTWRLTGRHVTDRGDASGTGWWSPATGTYQPEVLDGIWPDLLPLLPEVVDPRATVGTVATDEPGLPAGAVVAPGTGDNKAGALGLGLAPGDLAVSIGTSGTAYAVSDHPTADASGLVAGFADATGRYLPLVCTLNATKVTAAVARLLGADHQELDALALAAGPGAGGLTLVPYFDGERTPNRPDATGSLTGLRSDVSRQQLARASFEGVACSLLEAVDALAAASVPLDGRLFLVGGGARSAAYQRVLADLSARALVVPDAEEAVATGACVQAAAVYTGDPFDAVADRWHLGQGQRVEPAAVDREAIRSRYAEARG